MKRPRIAAPPGAVSAQAGAARVPMGIPVLRALLSTLIALATLSGATFLLMERPAWLPLLGRRERVMVVLVGNATSVARVRSALDPARIVAATPDAIALREGWIIAADAPSVAAPYREAGWMQREIAFLHVEKGDWPRESRRRSIAGDRREDAQRLDRLHDLVNKPTLSAGEQLFVLQAMNDGLEL